MKCPNCFELETRVKETRATDGNITVRTRQCASCNHRFKTRELPPPAWTICRANINSWEKRQTSPFKTLVRSRMKLTAKLLEMRASGMTAKEIAPLVGLTVNMVYHYTKPGSRK